MLPALLLTRTEKAAPLSPAVRLYGEFCQRLARVGAVAHRDRTDAGTARHLEIVRRVPDHQRLVAPGTGPVCAQPFRTEADLARLRPFDAEADTPYVLETVRQMVAALPAEVPLLGFAGAPFTVASYLIEGRPSRTYEHTKALIHTDPVTWHELMDRLAGHAIESIRSQLDAGAAARDLRGVCGDSDFAGVARGWLLQRDPPTNALRVAVL